MLNFTKKDFKELKENMFKELTDDNDSSNKNINVYYVDCGNGITVFAYV